MNRLFETHEADHGEHPWQVVCPVCGHNNSHIMQVGTLVGCDLGEAGIYPGTQPVGIVGLRRSALAIDFDGECEHSWRLIIQQHKGQNVVRILDTTRATTCGTQAQTLRPAVAREPTDESQFNVLRTAIDVLCAEGKPRSVRHLTKVSGLNKHVVRRLKKQLAECPY